MGGSNSTLTNSVVQSVSQSSTGQCLVPNVCQTVRVKDVDIGPIAGKGCDISIGTNTNSMGFGCSIAQTLMATSNIVSQLNNSSVAMLGEFANSEVNNSIGHMISQNMKATCGGTPPALGGGACRTGIVQAVDLENIKLAGVQDCDTFTFAANKSNAQVSCVISQVAKADAVTNQAVTNLAKGENWIASLLGSLALIALLMILGPVTLRKTLGAFRGRAAKKREMDAVEGAKAAVKLEQAKGAFLEQKLANEQLMAKAKAAGFSV